MFSIIYVEMCKIGFRCVHVCGDGEDVWRCVEMCKDMWKVFRYTCEIVNVVWRLVEIYVWSWEMLWQCCGVWK